MMRIRCATSVRGVAGAAGTASVLSDMRGLPQQGEFKVEGCTVPDLTFDMDLAGVFLNDAVCDSKSEARSATLTLFGCGLRGKEWIVDALHVLRRDSRSAIRDCDGHVTIHDGGHAQRASAVH